MKKITLLILLTISACGGPRGPKMTAEEEPAVMQCADFKVQTECVSLARHTPKCMWMNNNCIVESEALRSFMGMDQKWKVKIGESLGLGLSEPKFHGICNVTPRTADDFDDYIDGITLMFTRNSDQVKLQLDCSRASPVTYDFAYSAKEESGALLLTFDGKGVSIPGVVDAKSINVLDFFTKASWISNGRDRMIAISLYDMIFGKSQKSIPLTNQSEFDAAHQYSKSKHGAGVALGVPAAILIFEREWR